MSSLHELNQKIEDLNEAETVEFNRRMQLAKAIKESIAHFISDVERYDVQGVQSPSKIAALILFFLGAITAFPILNFYEVRVEAIILFALFFGIALVWIVKDQMGALESRLQKKIAAGNVRILERDWISLGSELPFLYSILETEKRISEDRMQFLNLQNIQATKSAQQKTLAEYEFILRIEIILNIQNEKNWWSKISVVSEQWHDL
ncbi:MAG: hypothetical protein WBJ21_09735 [Burkholderiaceae bacterium]|jgi:hypothetical protein